MIRASLLLLPVLLAACDGEPPAHLRVAGGDPARGRAVALEYGCGACHVIPGVRGAVSWAGPPLTEWARRGYLAGMALVPHAATLCPRSGSLDR